ncbi:MAG: hypothetical protein M0Z52_03850 [Actinomycetota bacterium]|nr:hypothetical protein [Actinomycetota bacterium]
MAFPGRRTFDEIAGVIGADNAKKFCEHFGGGVLYVPTIAIVMVSNRDNIIRAEYDNGVKVKQLITKYRIGERQIRRILNAK